MFWLSLSYLSRENLNLTPIYIYSRAHTFGQELRCAVVKSLGLLLSYGKIAKEELLPFLPYELSCQSEHAVSVLQVDQK